MQSSKLLFLTLHFLVFLQGPKHILYHNILRYAIYLKNHIVITFTEPNWSNIRIVLGDTASEIMILLGFS